MYVGGIKTSGFFAVGGGVAVVIVKFCLEFFLGFFSGGGMFFCLFVFGRVFI